MKIFALEIEIPNANWEDTSDLLKEEAMHVYQLQQTGIIREIYFTDLKNAVIIMECECIEKAQLVLSEFPLVKAGLIKFKAEALHPYTGFDRIIQK